MARRKQSRKQPKYQQQERETFKEIKETVVREKFKLEPRTLNQRLLMDELEDTDNQVIFVKGPSGCGKSLFSVHEAVRRFNDKIINKITIVRPMTCVDSFNVGALPGSLEERCDPYFTAVFEIFKNYYSKNRIQQMMKNGEIEMMIPAFSRGRTLSGFILVDEAQNLSTEEVKALLTRISEDTTMVFTGDPMQSDKNFGNRINGFSDFLDRLDKYGEVNGISVVELGKYDIQRSGIIKDILTIYGE